MSDFNNTEPTIEERLSNYGGVLKAHLEGTPDTDEVPTGMFLVGGTSTAVEPKRSSTRPLAAVVSLAAAVLLLVGVVVPSVTNNMEESITVAGIGVASQPQANDGVDGPGGNGSDQGVAHEGAANPTGVARESVDDTQPAADEDWSKFGVGAVASTDVATGDKVNSEDSTVDDSTGKVSTGEDSTDEDGTDEDTTGEDSASRVFDQAFGSADKEPVDEKKVEEKPAEEKPVEEKKDGEEKSAATGQCPDDAVVFGGECYHVVPPSCGDLEPAPTGDGCLKLVGAASAQSGCPGAYERDGDICLKHLVANVTCSQGTPLDGSCLIKKEATGGTAGCAEGQVEIGGNCYRLSAPTSFSCGDLDPLPNAQCRWPVSGESATSCAPGFEPLGGDTCYRYEDPPSYTCDAGESDGAGWCKITEPGTPGPDVCDEGVQQDESGCYILVDVQEDGTCGELAELAGQCRYPKSSYPTWTCSDGKTVYEDACLVWAEAVTSCAAGEPVSNGTKCKTIVDATATTGCPDYALEDGQGCYKAKPATLDCGDLHVAPDGENCKEWVSDASGSGGECEAGFDLVGSYCKKYVDGTPNCSGAELVELAGKPMCRYTKSAGPSSTGCGGGEVEKAGNCYLVTAPSCQELHVDVFGTGCKKPIKNS